MRISPCEFNPSKAIVAFTEAFRMLAEVLNSVQLGRCNKMWGSMLDVAVNSSSHLQSQNIMTIYEAILWVSYQAPLLSEEAGTFFGI